MTLGVVVILAVLTYASRVAALVLLPTPSSGVAAFLERMPAPLFAGLAAVAIVGEEGGIADPVTLAAIGGATLAAGRRTIPVILAAGLAAAGIAMWLT